MKQKLATEPGESEKDMFRRLDQGKVAEERDVLHFRATTRASASTSAATPGRKVKLAVKGLRRNIVQPTGGTETPNEQSQQQTKFARFVEQDSEEVFLSNIVTKESATEVRSTAVRNLGEKLDRR